MEQRVWVNQELAAVRGMTPDEADVELSRRVEIARAGRDAGLGTETDSAILPAGTSFAQNRNVIGKRNVFKLPHKTKKAKA